MGSDNVRKRSRAVSSEADLKEKKKKLGNRGEVKVLEKAEARRLKKKKLTIHAESEKEEDDDEDDKKGRAMVPEVSPLLGRAAAENPASKMFFSWLLGISEATFYKKYFEKAHLHVSHGDPGYFTTTSAASSSSSSSSSSSFPTVEWSTELMLKVVETSSPAIEYGKDLNVVRFDEKLKKRVSYKTEGVVTAEELRQCMKSGWSVRFLRPHEHTPCNSAFISLMESCFHCYCGLNSYWTPANSQGFAPHYDDVDVFLIQMEGEKEWRLYDPPEEVDYLSRHSSEDYVPEAFPTPKHTLRLRAGDVLYMPRGMVHQGRTLPHTHSLHITFSANQMNTWADFFLTACRYSVETLAANNEAWRRTLPQHFLACLGAAHHPDSLGMISDAVEEASAGTAAVLDPAFLPLREAYQAQVRQLTAELGLLLTDEVHMDFCVDEYAVEGVQKMQPPPHLFAASTRSSAAAAKTSSDKISKNTEKGSKTKKKKGEEEGLVSTSSRVRLLGGHGCRLVLNVEGEAILYHNAENNVVCLAGNLGQLRFEREFAPALSTLLSLPPSCAAGIRVAALPFPDFDEEEAGDVEENQLVLCQALLDAGLLEKVAEE